MNRTKMSVCVAIVALVALSSQAADRFVSLDGTNDSANGYNTWSGAATNIEWAVNAAQAGETIWVTNGTYCLTNRLTLNKKYTLKSVNGRDYTIIDGQNTKTSGWNVVITSAHAVIDGLTVSNGFCNNYQASGIFLNQYGRVINSRITHCWGEGNTWPGTGVYLNYGGTIIDSIIENCKAVTSGGVYVNNPGGIISNCLIRSNEGYRGAGVFLSKGGLLTDCVVISNRAPYHLSKGGGVYGEGGGTIRNTLIADNVAFNKDWATAAGGGVALVGSTSGRTEMINCTLTGNVSLTGGGLDLEGTNQTDAVINSIIYHNFSNATRLTPSDIAMSNPAYSNAFTHCCLPSVLPTDRACVDGDPQFFAAAKGRYQLRGSSPCVDAGSNQTWMAKSLDLGGNRRLFGNRVDIGAYEYRSEGTHFIVK